MEWKKNKNKNKSKTKQKNKKASKDLKPKKKNNHEKKDYQADIPHPKKKLKQQTQATQIMQKINERKTNKKTEKRQDWAKALSSSSPTPPFLK